MRKIVERNDERSFSVFFDHYHTRLIRLSLLFVPRMDQAEDVVAEVFLKLLGKKDSLLTIQNFEGYLFKMVKNESLRYIKSQNKKDTGNVLVDDIKDYLVVDQSDPEKRIVVVGIEKLRGGVSCWYSRVIESASKASPGSFMGIHIAMMRW
ncbi:hypothetical protein ADIS_0240 [Lunatimonas lonarensis]|uniref:RNA polymerase sigma-70 region 2 domain-containing protein n=1 Tax=Lunatimonas lonarensis TaxID=1232681 RepID=R7ZYS1_9BACT|nr:hypothetical protein ADIS_0240 [Lunatimonas lonarensis]